MSGGGGDEFLKPEIPDRTQSARRRGGMLVPERGGPAREGERLVLRTRMPNTVGFWWDSMVANAAFKSEDDSFRLTCLCAMQQRAKNEVQRRPNKAHWDYLLDEAEWLRRDFREERMLKTALAKAVAEGCVEEWAARVEERGHFVVVQNGKGEVVGLASALGYRREGSSVRSWDGSFAMRVKAADVESKETVLGKRKRSNEEGEVDVQRSHEEAEDV